MLIEIRLSLMPDIFLDRFCSHEGGLEMEGESDLGQGTFILHDKKTIEVRQAEGGG